MLNLMRFILARMIATGDGQDALPWVSHAALAVLLRNRDGSSTFPAP